MNSSSIKVKNALLILSFQRENECMCGERERVRKSESLIMNEWMNEWVPCGETTSNEKVTLHIDITYSGCICTKYVFHTMCAVLRWKNILSFLRTNEARWKGSQKDYRESLKVIWPSLLPHTMRRALFKHVIPLVTGIYIITSENQKNRGREREGNEMKWKRSQLLWEGSHESNQTRAFDHWCHQREVECIEDRSMSSLPSLQLVDCNPIDQLSFIIEQLHWGEEWEWEWMIWYTWEWSERAHRVCNIEWFDKKERQRRSHSREVVSLHCRHVHTTTCISPLLHSTTSNTTLLDPTLHNNPRTYKNQVSFSHPSHNYSNKPNETSVSSKLIGIVTSRSHTIEVPVQSASSRGSHATLLMGSRGTFGS